VSDSTYVHPDSNDLWQQGLLLSHEFSQLEGRQPRVLVGNSIKISQQVIRKVCSSLADMGFNVDVAPVLGSFDELATQCLENDADVLLILGAEHITRTELTNLAKKVSFLKPETLKALTFQSPESIVNSETLRELYQIFPEDSDPVEISFALLKILMSID